MYKETILADFIHRIVTFYTEIPLKTSFKAYIQYLIGDYLAEIERPERRIAFCPHCSNVTPQTLVHTQQFEDVGYSVSDDPKVPEEIPMKGKYFVAICETCKQVLLYSSFESDAFNTSELNWPSSHKLHHSVPEKVANIFQEASRIKNIAPNAFAVQIRRALEAVCDDRGAKKGTLQERLKELSERNEIPPVLAEITDALRILGNIGAHSSDQEVKQYHVWTINDFFRAIIEYVYVAPSKLKDFRDKLKTNSQKKSKK